MAESDAELTEIPASEILDKIQIGEPAVYDHVRVTDDLDVNKLDLPTKHVDRTENLKKFQGISEECKVVSASIKITNSTFNGRVNFSNIFFEDEINFRNTTFSFADFSGTTFSGSTSFNGTKFSGIADFSGATFSELKVETVVAKCEGVAIAGNVVGSTISIIDASDEFAAHITIRGDKAEWKSRISKLIDEEWEKAREGVILALRYFLWVTSR